MSNYVAKLQLVLIFLLLEVFDTHNEVFARDLDAYSFYVKLIKNPDDFPVVINKNPQLDMLKPQNLTRKASYVFGRSQNADIFIDAGRSLSREQLKLVWSPKLKLWYLANVGKNSIYINNSLVGQNSVLPIKLNCKKQKNGIVQRVVSIGFLKSAEREYKVGLHLIINWNVRLSNASNTGSACSVNKVASQQLYKLKVDQKYGITKKIGQGGFGVVYAGNSLNDVSEKVILKELHNLDSGSEKLREKVKEMFQRERNFLAAFGGQANIPKFFDFIECNNRAFLVMELIPGYTLDEYHEVQVNRKKLIPVTQVFKYINDVLDTIIFMHRMGYAHRDIKPENIILNTKTKKANLIDYGLVKLILPGLPGSKGTMVGSAGYTSADQFAGAQTTVQFDIYSIGATLFFLLTGEQVDSENPHLARTKLFNSINLIRNNITNPLLQEKIEDNPMALINIVTKALNADSVNQFKSAQEMKNAIHVLFSKR